MFKTLGNPQSSIAIHISRERKTDERVRGSAKEAVNNIHHNQLIDSLRNNTFFTKDYNVYPNLKPSHAAFYNQHVLVDFDKSLTILESTNSQNTAEWHLERSKRIKASIAYELYTYTRNKSPNWGRKVLQYLKPSKHQPPAMKYGIQMEPEAISWYEQDRRIKVSKHGFTIHPNASFIVALMPLFFAESRLVEVKCPILGKTEALTHLKI